MSATLISPSGTVLHHRARVHTTPSTEDQAKAVRVLLQKEARLEQNRAYLRHPNVRAFLQALAGAGLYQSAIDTWLQQGGAMGLTVFTQETQDLIAVENLRALGVLDALLEGDVRAALQATGAGALCVERYLAAGGAPG